MQMIEQAGIYHREFNSAALEKQADVKAKED